MVCYYMVAQAAELLHFLENMMRLELHNSPNWCIYIYIPTSLTLLKQKSTIHLIPFYPFPRKKLSLDNLSLHLPLFSVGNSSVMPDQ